MFEHGSRALVVELAFWSQGVTNPAYPLKQFGRLCGEVSDKFRALAIVQLLTEGKTDSFLHNLMRSGRTRETYLLRMQAAGVSDDHHQVSGRFRPLLDAIAADDLERARRIAQLVPSQFRPGHEYEDDYCYAQLIQRLLADEVPVDECEALMERFAAWLDGQPSARLDVCRALVAADQAAFDEAFEALLVAHEQAIEADRERGKHEDDSVIAERQVSVEALAILRLAGRRGLVTADDYRYCPSLARVPMTTPFPAV